MTYPLITFFIVAYNQEKYIAEAIDGAFAQDYPNMEIIISDDCSSDNTWDIIQARAAQYKGPHKVILNRNEPNMGPREHINKILYELSHGEIIVVSAGDDISLPQRTKVAMDMMLKHPEVVSLSFQSQLVDENLKPLDLRQPEEGLSVGQDTIITMDDYVTYPYFIFSGESRVLRRSVIDAFPPLKYPFAEDIFWFVRGFYVGSVAYIRQPLVLYRQLTSSIMGKERANKSFDEEKFNNTTARQIWEDYEYAVKHGYIDARLKDCVAKKLTWLLYSLKPSIAKQKKHTLIYRILRAIKHEIVRN